MASKGGDKAIEKTYELARQRYAELGVSTDAALRRLKEVPLSLHVWQGDDLGGFDGGTLDGGLAATGNFPGKARTAEELRGDLEKAWTLIPGRRRLNLHAMYAETRGRRVERNELKVEHFAHWIDWAKSLKLGLDFNGTFFSHPKAADGFTLSHHDKGIRQFWIEHGIIAREIGAAMGKAMGTPCVCDVWIPDGYKDIPADRLAPRQRLRDSLDRLFARKYDPRLLLDALEGKLFGLGSESYVVGSHEFYLGYAVANKKLMCLDTGHFHPTETVADKISAVLLFVPELLLHVSRGVRWDSDHAVILSDELEALALELVRGDFLERVHIGLDYFDASINRLAAYAVGARAMYKALLLALLEPSDRMRGFENAGDFTSRLVVMESLKVMPFSAVWDYFCLIESVPVGSALLAELKKYEKDVLLKRG